MKFSRLVLFFVGLIHIHPSQMEAAAELTYVCNLGGDSLGVVDAQTNVLLNTIPLGRTPREITVLADGSRAYITEQAGNEIIVVDLITDAVSTILTPATSAAGITSNETTVYFLDNGATSSLYTIDIATDTVAVGAGPLGGNPYALTLTPEGDELWIINSGSNTYSVYSVPALALLAGPTGTGTTPGDVSFSATHAYIPNQVSDNMTVVDRGTYAVSSTIPAGTLGIDAPQTIRIVNGKGYITSLTASSLGVLDTSTDTMLPAIPLPAPASFGMVRLASDGSIGFVSEFGAGTMSKINLTTDTVDSTIGGFFSPFGLAVFSEEEEEEVVPVIIPVRGVCIKDISLSQINLINVISWDSPEGAVVINYQLFRDGKLIADIDGGGPFEFSDPNRKKNTTYVYTFRAPTTTDLILEAQISITCR